MSEALNIITNTETKDVLLTPQAGERLGHIIDEYVTVSTLVTAQHVSRNM